MAGESVKHPLRLFVSGYTDSADDPGIHVFDLSADGSTATKVGSCAGVQSPSFIIVNGKRVYAASECPDQGCLAHYELDDQGIPQLVDQVHFAHADETCYVLEHASGSRLYGADYGSGSACTCELDASGALQEPVQLIQHGGHGATRRTGDPNFNRQTSTHVHTLSFVPGTSLLAAVDLGLDIITIYRTDEQGSILASAEPTITNFWPAGTRGDSVVDLPLRPAAIVEAPLYSGPRIIAYHPTKAIAALVCELSCEVILFHISEDGLHWEPFAQWDLLQDVPASEIELQTEAPRGAHCEFTSDGRFLYASCRGVDRMTVFRIDENCDLLERHDCPSYGGTPRHFALSPNDGLLAVANKTGNDVIVFKRDAVTGTLEFATRIPVSGPSCIVWKQR